MVHHFISDSKQTVQYSMVTTSHRRPKKTTKISSTDSLQPESLMSDSLAQKQPEQPLFWMSDEFKISNCFNVQSFCLFHVVHYSKYMKIF